MTVGARRGVAAMVMLFFLGLPLGARGDRGRSFTAGVGPFGRGGSAVPVTGLQLQLAGRQPLARHLTLDLGLGVGLSAEGTKFSRGQRALLGLDLMAVLRLPVHVSAVLELGLGAGGTLSLDRLVVFEASRIAARPGGGGVARLGMRFALGRGSLGLGLRGLLGPRLWQLGVLLDVGVPL